MKLSRDILPLTDFKHRTPEFVQQLGFRAECSRLDGRAPRSDIGGQGASVRSYNGNEQLPRLDIRLDPSLAQRLSDAQLHRVFPDGGVAPRDDDHLA